MEYRKLKGVETPVSVIGFGGVYLEGMPGDEIIEMVYHAMDLGINLLDLYMPQPEIRDAIGAAVRTHPGKMLIQGHLCTVCDQGQYVRSRNLEEVKRSFEDMLNRLGQDYVDFGMIHFLDSEKDVESVKKSGILDYAINLKEQGVIRKLGFSSHNAVTAMKLVETGLYEMLMFSLNPAYDLDHGQREVEDIMAFKGVAVDEKALGIAPVRSALYQRCEAMGIGITVMKALAAGRLLSAESSPFGRAMTPAQCYHYALDRPGVVSVLPGFSSLREIDEAAAYCRSSEIERDYSAIADAPSFQLQGQCMYCNHCQPCPSGIDVAAVTKYLDVARQHKGRIPGATAEHYKALKAHGSDCIECGSCVKRCPFGVDVIRNMQEASGIFGL
ncbi:aldo/keto reductase [Eubacterium sp. 1001713B170207_170306_E7]|uniref:aldo/keto reductase n=1 Tax=Eubacterium sp. 1001713B170207_170306_E7 TaxID=2787097 RepID=UPI00189C1835